ncbi:MAG: hypothetical protein Q4C71_04465, partial [Microbacteriaceae bacterium]|nr:hypothetical protein [Microbacteriaceae bacterium]
MSFSFRKKIAAALTAVALALGVGFVATAPAAQADEVTFDPQATTEVGKKSDDVALDAKRNRLYVVDSGEGKPTDKTSKVTWLNSADNTAAAESINLEEGVAKKLLLSNDGDTLFVVHSKSTNAISIINLNDNSVKKIDKLVASPHSINGVVQGSASDKLYIYERTAINTLNPTTLEKGTKIALPDSMTYIDPPKAGVRPHPFASNQIDKMVYDSTRNYFWTIVTNANRSKGFVTVFDLNKNAWREDIKLDLREKTFTNGVLGGVPSNLAFDKAHGALHIVVKKWTGNPNPESWPGTDEARMVTYDIETGNTLGDSFVSLRGSGEIEVNPVTHEVYVAIPANNTLAVISPKTWTAKTVHDYNEAIAINGVNNANTFGLAIDSEKGKVYTSHPAGRGNTKVSVLSRTGETPAYTDRKPTRIGLVVEEEAAVNWHGPAAPEVTPAAAGVCEPTISDINFNWGLSGYVRDYFSLVYRYGDNVKKNDDRSATWTAGKGRYDEKTGAGELIWPGGINYAGYGNAGFNYGNPKLEVRADKTASLSMDIEIHYGMPNVNPKGF